MTFTQHERRGRVRVPVGEGGGLVVHNWSHWLSAYYGQIGNGLFDDLLPILKYTFCYKYYSQYHFEDELCHSVYLPISKDVQLVLTASMLSKPTLE